MSVDLKIGQVWEIYIEGEYAPCLLLEKRSKLSFICLNLETGRKFVVGSWRWDTSCLTPSDRVMSTLIVKKSFF